MQTVPVVLPTDDTNCTRVYRYLDNERDTRKGQATAGSRKATLGKYFRLQVFKSSFSWEVLFHLTSTWPSLNVKVPPPPRSSP